MFLLSSQTVHGWSLSLKPGQRTLTQRYGASSQTSTADSATHGMQAYVMYDTIAVLHTAALLQAVRHWGSHITSRLPLCQFLLMPPITKTANLMCTAASPITTAFSCSPCPSSSSSTRRKAAPYVPPQSC
eukprot:1157279-Pelagomonas_calceolata.AAC.2